MILIKYIKTVIETKDETVCRVFKSEKEAHKYIKSLKKYYEVKDIKVTPLTLNIFNTDNFFENDLVKIIDEYAQEYSTMV